MRRLSVLSATILLTTLLITGCAKESSDDGRSGDDQINGTAERTAVVEAASVTVRPSGDGESWTFDYALNHPSTELRLYRPSDGSRAKGWRLSDDDFELIARPYEDGEEDVIRRRDGAPFTSISVTEKIAHDPAVKGYWPFASLGDDRGIFGYTGRILACAEECPVDATGADGPFPVTIDPGDAPYFLVGSAIKDAPYTYFDRNDGLKFYAGDVPPVETDDFVAVIDPALPGDIKARLDGLFPKLMAYFAENLGAADRKPSMFVSYNAPGDHEGSHIKGGTLPGQLFMHFEGARTVEIAKRPTFPHFLAWFFAHEAAHLFQKYRGVDFPEDESWIHEGGADFFAFLALRSLAAAPQDYLNLRLNRALDRCAEELARGPLRAANERGNFQAYYDCGLLLHMAAAEEVAAADGRDAFALWTSYVETAKAEGEWSTKVFAAFIESLGAANAAGLARNVLDTPQDAPRASLLQGLAAAGVDVAWADDAE
ncbi:MAG: hypothetical protein AAFX08_04195 [Pseudomonadota bacterium]